VRIKLIRASLLEVSRPEEGREVRLISWFSGRGSRTVEDLRRAARLRVHHAPFISPAASFSQDSWVTVKVDGDRFLLGTESIENSDWVLALILPYRDMILMSARPIRQTLIVFLLIISLTLSLALPVDCPIAARREKEPRSPSRSP
jgi:hypothetical protein